jgi:(1->4)-alpha-D-glucan 1-alpha-D-glucosylmutase
MEYLLYQTLVGALPITSDRAVAYMEKAAHEAKLQTSWLHPDEAYDAALRDFTSAVLGDARFLADITAFVNTLVPFARTNSLAMTLLKLTSPGVPDIYQGCELWDHSLVDPDNRRPVDYAVRRTLLDAAAGRTPADAWREQPDSGAAKQWLIAAALQLRQRAPGAFDERGDYAPMHAEGSFADDVIAFGRGTPAAVTVIAQRRPLRRRGEWSDTMISLPAGEWRNLCDGASALHGQLDLAALLERFPVALLERTA